VHALRIVIELDVLEYLLSGLLLVLVYLPLDKLLLQRLEKRLGDCIVVWVARTRNRLRDAMTLKRSLECAGGVLRFLIVMEDKSAIRRVLAADGLPQGIYDEVLAHMGGHRLADHFSRKDVYHGREIEKALSCRHIGDVPHPKPVSARYGKDLLD
jgi:hypothetical protein